MEWTACRYNSSMSNSFAKLSSRLAKFLNLILHLLQGCLARPALVFIRSTTCWNTSASRQRIQFDHKVRKLDVDTAKARPYRLLVQFPCHISETGLAR